MSPDRMHQLQEAFTDVGGGVQIGTPHLSVTNGDRFARYTKRGWLLFRPGLNGVSGFYAEECSDDLALVFIETGDIRTTRDTPSPS